MKVDEVILYYSDKEHYITKEECFFDAPQKFEVIIHKGMLLLSPKPPVKYKMLTNILPDVFQSVDKNGKIIYLDKSKNPIKYWKDIFGT